jgi:hypothetical protein
MMNDIIARDASMSIVIDVGPAIAGGKDQTP